MTDPHDIKRPQRPPGDPRASEHAQHDARQSAGRPPTATLAVLLWMIAAGVLVQAALAGLFLSGVANARLAHTIVGWLLPFAALVPAVLAGIKRSAGQVSRPVAIWTGLLPVGLWVQEMLGHVPAPVTTAIHVPLGVTLFGGSIALAIAARRPVTPALRPTSR